jgi:hypothetical protein
MSRGVLIWIIRVNSCTDRLKSMQVIPSCMPGKTTASCGPRLAVLRAWTRYWRFIWEKSIFIVQPVPKQSCSQFILHSASAMINANGLWRRKDGGKRACRGCYSVLFFYRNCVYVLSNQTACNRGSTNFYTHERSSGHHDWHELCRTRLLTYARPTMESVFIWGIK